MKGKTPKKSILVIGMGRFGIGAARKFISLGHEVMVLDKDEERVRRIADEAVSARVGDASDPDILKSLDAEEFDLCVVAVGDEVLDAWEITATLKELGVARVVSRANDETEEKLLLRVGADAVVFPEREMAEWTAVRYGYDGLINYVAVSDGYSAYEMRIPEAWNGKRIDEIDVRRRYGVSILGIRSATMNMNPPHDAVLRSRDAMLVLGKDEDIRKLMRL